MMSGPLMKTEANIGEPFTVSAPAEVVFKESGLILYIDSFSSYIDFGFLPLGAKLFQRPLMY